MYGIVSSLKHFSEIILPCKEPLEMGGPDQGSTNFQVRLDSMLDFVGHTFSINTSYSHIALFLFLVSLITFCCVLNVIVSNPLLDKVFEYRDQVLITQCTQFLA